MQFTIKTDSLQRALKSLKPAIGQHQFIPVLRNVLINASAMAEGVAFTGADLDIEVSCEPSSGDVIVTEPGSATVNFKRLLDVSAKLPKRQDVTICKGDSDLVLTCGAIEYTVCTLPAADFPDFKAFPQTARFEMPSADLIRIIDRTRFAISTDEKRHYLNGIYLHALEEDGQSLLRAVATDGHRLALADSPCPAGAEGMAGIIIPTLAIKALLHNRARLKEVVRIDVGAKKVTIKSGLFDGITIRSKLVDGTYPDIYRVVPKANDKIATVNRLALLSAVELAARVQSAAKFTFGGSVLQVSADGIEAGRINITIPSDGVDSFEVGFNPKYMRDTLKNLAGECVRIEMLDASAAVVISGSEPGVRCVLMPLRV